MRGRDDKSVGRCASSSISLFRALALPDCSQSPSLRSILKFALAVSNLLSTNLLNLAIELLTTNFHPVSKKFEPLTTAFAQLEGKVAQHGKTAKNLHLQTQHFLTEFAFTEFLDLKLRSLAVSMHLKKNLFTRPISGFASSAPSQDVQL